MPGSSVRRRWRAAGASPPWKGRSTTSHRAWVPVSMRATTRSWGKAPRPRWVVGRPKARAFAGVSAASRVVPSTAMRRSPPRKALGVAGVAIGPATAWNSSRNSRTPTRRRARTRAAVLGRCHRARAAPPAGPSAAARRARVSSQPSTTVARTWRTDSAAHSPIATTRDTTRCVGSRRRRRSRAPVRSITSSTAASGNAASRASSSGRPPAPAGPATASQDHPRKPMPPSPRPSPSAARLPGRA